MGSSAFLVETCRQLGDELVRSWAAHQATPSDIPADEDEVLYARRLIAQRCLYGVDKNVMAVDLAKLSLWLVTLARDHPFTFLDHSMRHGDSLVGLSRDQIISFHWKPKKQTTFGEQLIQHRLDRATEARAKILNAREDASYRDQQQKLALAEEALSTIRLLGDACISAFFSGKNKRDREERVDQLAGIAGAYLEEPKAGRPGLELVQSLRDAADTLKQGKHPIKPIHWEIEFPEMFSGADGGFAGFVGNPPFMGGRNMTSSCGDTYPDALRYLQRDISGSVDLVSHFFRRSHAHLRPRGCMGLIAKNSISQGDTRSASLRHIRRAGGEIYDARKSPFDWFAVLQSQVHEVWSHFFSGTAMD